MKKSIFLLFIVCVLSPSIFAQKNKEKDKAVFKERKKGYFQNTVLKNISDHKNADKAEPKKYFSVDFNVYEFPTTIDEYTSIWHNQPINQGLTGTCWSFASTSFFESEAKRISNIEIKLSEMFSVYYEYVDRAIYFVKNRGEMHFGQGSEANALKRIMKNYGTIPYSDYTGLLKCQKSYDHSKMFDEMNSYLKWVKNDNAWNENVVVETIKDILNYYMCTPPETIVF